MQSFVNEPNFQENWYVEGITEGQKLGEAKRVLKPDIYNRLYQPILVIKSTPTGEWKYITTQANSNESVLGSEIVIQTDLQSFAFRKFEFMPKEAVLIDTK